MAIVVLDLDEELHLGAGAMAQNIRGDALRLVLQQLVERPGYDERLLGDKGSRPLRLDVLHRRTHSTILVNARRGDGKTTFLTHLLYLIEQGKSAYAKELGRENDASVSDLYSLGIIDPTLIESKQNIVVIILDKIRDAVDQKLKLEPGRSGEHSDVRSELRRLASGLTLLDGIGAEDLYGKDWADPDYVLQQGLDRARAAGEFERAFYNYVRRACSFVGVDAFVIAIDDVDTSFDKGWPVLEALRKYMATDRLRVILSGDLNLYNVLVRREQWRQITPEFLRAESMLPEKYKQTERLGQLVEELQDQYLIKIVPTERRVDLRPLLELTATSLLQAGAIPLKFSVFGDEVEPMKYARAMAREIVRAALPADQEAFASAILRLPLRSAVRILRAGRKVYLEGFGRGREEEFFEAMRQVLSSVLLNRDIDAASLAEAEPRRIMFALTDWLTKHDRWGHGARFTAGSGHEDYDLVSIFVAAALVRLFRGRPDAMLEFAFRICAVREKVEREGLTVEETRSLTLHLWPTAVDSPVRFVSRLSAWDAASTRSSGGAVGAGLRLSGVSVPPILVKNWNAVFAQLYGMSYSIKGSLPVLDRSRFADTIMGDDQEVKDTLLKTLPAPIRGFHSQLAASTKSIYRLAGVDGGTYYSFGNSIETLRNGLKGGASAIVMLGASRISKGQSSEMGVYSVLRLVATVAELAALRPGSFSRADMTARIESLLNEAELFRSFPSPGQGASSPSVDEQPGLDDEDEEIGADEAVSGHRASSEMAKRKVFVDMMTTWMNRQDGAEAAMSPQTLSRAWTRFTYAFDGVRAGLVVGQTRYLGVLVHRTIVAFLHAMGVEAYRTTSRPIQTAMYRNPTTSSMPFQRLLQSIYDNDDPELIESPEIAFFDRLFSCPIWGYFLARRDSDVADAARIDYNSRIFQQYMLRLRFSDDDRDHEDSDAASDAARRQQDDRFAVGFMHPAGRMPVMFDGFFFLLNTVPLHGVSGARPRLNEALAELSASRVRRVRRPRPSTPPTPTDESSN